MIDEIVTRKNAYKVVTLQCELAFPTRSASLKLQTRSSLFHLGNSTLHTLNLLIVNVHLTGLLNCQAVCSHKSKGGSLTKVKGGDKKKMSLVELC